jgi:beta-1,4-N-acetylglucosaminyltransferase
MARDEVGIFKGHLCGEVAMIFVTVGSVAPFDDLIKEVDRLTEKGVIGDVVAQIGNGTYIPKNAKWFRFKKELIDYYHPAELVITHSGAGTLFEVLKEGKKAIAVPNPNIVHNPDIIMKLSNEGHILLCPNLNQLEERILQARSWIPKEYKEPPCRIHEIITEYLLGPSK